MHSMCVEVRAQVSGVGSLLPCVLWTLNSNCQAWQQLTLPAEPALPPKLILLIHIFVYLLTGKMLFLVCIILL